MVFSWGGGSCGGFHVGRLCRGTNLGVGRDVYVLRGGLFGGETPAADMMVSLFPLTIVRSLLFQFLPLVLRPTILEPHFHLRRNNKRISTVDSNPSYQK